MTSLFICCNLFCVPTNCAPTVQLYFAYLGRQVKITGMLRDGFLYGLNLYMYAKVDVVYLVLLKCGQE
jgi:hypothetical protein